MRRLLSVVLALGMVLLLVTPCFADNLFHKFGRGLINDATGWLEYPKQIVEVSKEHNAAVGITWGQAKGVAKGLERTGLGVYDTSFFYLPPYDKPVLDPKYVFEF